MNEALTPFEAGIKTEFANPPVVLYQDLETGVRILRAFATSTDYLKLKTTLGPEHVWRLDLLTIKGFRNRASAAARAGGCAIVSAHELKSSLSLMKSWIMDWAFDFNQQPELLLSLDWFRNKAEMEAEKRAENTLRLFCDLCGIRMTVDRSTAADERNNRDPVDLCRKAVLRVHGLGCFSDTNGLPRGYNPARTI